MKGLGKKVNDSSNHTDNDLITDSKTRRVLRKRERAREKRAWKSETKKGN